MELIMNDALLIRYLTETVTVEENAQVMQWCAMSPDNQNTLEQMYFVLLTSECLRVMQSVNHDKALGRWKDRIRQQEKAAKRRFMIRLLQRVAAILFLPVVLLSAWLLMQKNETLEQYIEFFSNPGMMASLELPDGSKVWLNGGSSLRYPCVFSGNTREVQIKGQGYFEIVHNDLPPFLVRTDEPFSLEVLGTSFTIAAYDDEDIIEMTLVEGSVCLKLLKEDRMIQHLIRPKEPPSQ